LIRRGTDTGGLSMPHMEEERAKGKHSRKAAICRLEEPLLEKQSACILTWDFQLLEL
jgi:hypothetical protein